MSDIASTKLKFFGPLNQFQVQRAGNGFGYRAEFEQNKDVQAEFRAE